MKLAIMTWSYLCQWLWVSDERNEDRMCLSVMSSSPTLASLLLHTFYGKANTGINLGDGMATVEFCAQF